MRRLVLLLVLVAAAIAIAPAGAQAAYSERYCAFSSSATSWAYIYGNPPEPCFAGYHDIDAAAWQAAVDAVGLGPSYQGLVCVDQVPPSQILMWEVNTSHTISACSGLEPVQSDTQTLSDFVDGTGGTTPYGAPSPTSSGGGSVDSDSDGVPDSRDACPDSPAGDPVGPDGCPVDPNAAPPGKDAAPGSTGSITNLPGSIARDAKDLAHAIAPYAFGLMALMFVLALAHRLIRSMEG